MFTPNVYSDWYRDGIEESKNGPEELWRLDFKVEVPMQAQIFAVPDNEDCPTSYFKPRLFIERDVRDASSNRIDYACSSWDISEVLATTLLGMNVNSAVQTMLPYINVVLRLPCDSAYLGTAKDREEKLCQSVATITKEEFEKLYDEYSGCLFHISQDGSQTLRAIERMKQIEKKLKDSPWEYDEDNNVVKSILKRGDQ